MERSFLTAGLFVVGVLLAGFVLLLATLVIRQDSLLYFPTRILASKPSAHGLRAEEVNLRAEDAISLHGWWIHGGGQRALIFFHGNGGNIADRLERARVLTERFGLDILLIDYRGFGHSDGSPSEAGLYRDARAAYDEAVRRGFGPDRLILFGESLGAAVALQLATEHSCAGLVLETPFLSIPAMAAVHYPFVPTFLIRARYDNAGKIGTVNVPTLLILAENDEVAPSTQGRALFEIAHEPKTLVVIPGARHNDVYGIGGEAYWRTWKNFLEAIGALGI